MKKVCHITSAHSSDDTRIFHNQCVSLAKAGYDTYLVAPGVDNKINGVNIIGIKTADNRLQRMIDITKIAYQTAKTLDADIYHLHDPELLPYALKLKKNGKIVIFDSHENYTESISQKFWIPKLFRKIIQFMFNRYYFNVLTKIDALIAVPHNYEFIKNVNRTINVANYPVILNFDVAAKPLPSRTICFAGGIAEQWSHENTLKALFLCKNVNYNLCGFAQNNYLDKLAKNKAWKDVNYLGTIAYLEVANILKSSNIGMALLKPSNNTNGKLGSLSSTKLFEYMLVGIPFICTNFILWEEIVKEYDCGICVDPENIEEIAQAINYLLDNPNVAKQMGENGRRAVLEKYNWGVEEKKLLKLYEELLNK